MNHRKIISPRNSKIPLRLVINRPKERKWYNIKYREAKKFILEKLFFVLYVTIDLIIIYILERFFKKNIQIRLLFFVAMAHIYQKTYDSFIGFDFYKRLIPNDRYKLMMKICMLGTYFLRIFADFPCKNTIPLNLRIHNKYFALALGTIWSIASYLVIYFTMYPLQYFFYDYRNLSGALISFFIFLNFFIIVNSYEMTLLLTNMFIKFEFLTLAPSYLVVGFLFYKDAKFYCANHNYLHYIIYLSVYICLQWPFLVNIFKYLVNINLL
ncbi:hypothetical protein CWI38_0088p0070 [Hamiltosporidium tvaerminnensis]|uniref:Uncharacterized protein n=1 Tax=Hamiltosporidium tvaerminnensis TaxID=1176355 RepID=A0A4Q9M3N5_9MICR|nr:hypothetical protein CWI38_0088p0070 [Hamiltosporidium tvaerminnensis]